MIQILMKANIQYLQQSFYQPWINPNILTNGANIQQIDQLVS
jgi:hypothetical protein